MHSVNGLTIVMGSFNASLRESVEGFVGPHALERTNGNEERLVSFP